MSINSYNVFTPNYPVFGTNSKNGLSLDEIRNSVELYKYYSSSSDILILDSIDKLKFNGIGLYNTSDIEFDIQYHLSRINSAPSSNGYVIDFDFEHSLDLLLYKFYGVSIEKSRNITNYNLISSAIMTLTIERIQMVSMDVFVDLSSSLNSFLLSCRARSCGSSRMMIIYFLQGIHENKKELFKSMASKLCEVTKAKALYSGLSGFMLSYVSGSDDILNTVYEDRYSSEPYKLKVERREFYANR